MSAAYAGRKSIEQLEHWLADVAGVSLLNESHRYAASTPEGDGLENALALCQSMIIPLTRKAIESGWVAAQFDAGMNRQRMDGGMFRIIPVRVDDCDIPEIFQSSRWIDISWNGLSGESAAKILSGLYPNPVRAWDGKSHDVYLIRSWKKAGDGFEDAVCETAKRLGFHLVVNPDENPTVEHSAESIISVCGAGIAILRSGMSGTKLQRVYRELDLFGRLGLPYIMIADKALNLPTSVTQSSLQTLIIDEETESIETVLSTKIQPLLLKLQEEWNPPPVRPYIFYGTDLKQEHKHRNRLVRQIIQQIVSMPCLMGEDIQHGQIQQEIVNRVINARMMVADISKENLNTCIEAGIALGANVPVHLVSGDERHKPPFMFRDRQIWHYQTDLDLLGIVHKLVLPHRRIFV